MTVDFSDEDIVCGRADKRKTERGKKELVAGVEEKECR